MNKFWVIYLVFSLFLRTQIKAQESAQERGPSTIIVTCATGELGRAIAKELAQENNLILTGRNSDKLQKLKLELTAGNSWSYEVVELDYSLPEKILKFEYFLKSKKGEISGLVLITPRPQFSSNLLQPESNWLNLFQTTFTGPIEALKKAIPHFASESKIAIIGGTTSVQLSPQYGPACIIRRLWTTFSKALSHELGPKGISVNILSPGVVLTSYHKERIAAKAEQSSISYDEQMEQEVENIPLRRHANPDEVAKAVKFLLSIDSNFITGVNLVIDGGVTLGY